MEKQNAPQGHPAQAEEKKDGHPQTGPEVEITVDGVVVRIHRGHRTVVEIKQAAGLALAKDLCQLIDNRLVALADDGAVVLKGGEVFISHPKDGSSA